MTKKHKKELTIDPNKLYPSIKYGIHPEHLSLLAWLNIFFVAGIYLVFNAGWFSDYDGYIQRIFLTATVITIIGILLSLFKTFTKRFQITAYIFVFFESLITCLWMSLSGLALWIPTEDNQAGVLFSTNSLYFIFPTLGLFVVSLISFTIYHQKKTVLKLNKGKALTYPLSLGVIASVTVLGRHISSPISQSIASIIFVIIGAGLMPGGVVGAAFCIIDLIKHPELKEKYE